MRFCARCASRRWVSSRISQHAQVTEVVDPYDLALRHPADGAKSGAVRAVGHQASEPPHLPGNSGAANPLLFTGPPTADGAAEPEMQAETCVACPMHVIALRPSGLSPAPSTATPEQLGDLLAGFAAAAAEVPAHVVIPRVACEPPVADTTGAAVSTAGGTLWSTSATARKPPADLPPRWHLTLRPPRRAETRVGRPSDPARAAGSRPGRCAGTSCAALGPPRPRASMRRR